MFSKFRAKKTFLTLKLLFSEFFLLMHHEIKVGLLTLISEIKTQDLNENILKFVFLNFSLELPGLNQMLRQNLGVKKHFLKDTLRRESDF